MKTLLSTVCAATIALGAIAPLQAAPLQVPVKAPAASAEVIQVQTTRWEQRQRYMRGRDGRDWRRDYNRRHRHWRYRHRDRDDDLAIGLGAFAAGALLGGALNSGPRVIYRDRYRGVSSAHVEWCYNRYRSYRAYDNTFQPYNGPRRPCYSPYS